MPGECAWKSSSDRRAPLLCAGPSPLAPGRLQKDPLQGQASLPSLQQFCSRGTGERLDLLFKIGGSVLDDVLRPLFDGDKIGKPAFTNQRPPEHDADSIANVLHLLEQMRGQQDRLAAAFEF